MRQIQVGPKGRQLETSQNIIAILIPHKVSITITSQYVIHVPMTPFVILLFSLFQFTTYVEVPRKQLKSPQKITSLFFQTKMVL